MASQIESKITQVQSLLDNLLPWMATQIKSEHIELKSLHISDVLSNSITDLEETISRKSIRIESKVDKKQKVYGHSDSLRMVIRNLLHNALKFSHEKSKIDIIGFRSNGHYFLEIIDYGIGIEGSKLVNIFKSSIKFC